MTTPCLVCGIGSIAAAAVLSVETSSLNPTALAAGITAVALALTYVVKIVTPSLADAIRTIGPALAELQKQRDEIRKGSLSGQIDRLQAELTENTRRTNDANQKLHDLANEANTAALRHTEEIARLTEQLKLAADELTETRGELQKARNEIENLRENESRLLTRLTTSQIRQDVEIGENKAAIEKVKADQSGTMRAVRPEDGGGTPH